MKDKYSLECLSPRGERVNTPRAGLTAPRVTDLTGKRLALIWDGKAGGNNFWTAFAGLLRERIPGLDLATAAWGDTREAETVKREADTFVYGVGDSGVGAWEGASRTIEMEKLGKPGVFVVCDALLENARLSAAAQGMPAVRIVTVPSLEYYGTRSSPEAMAPLADAAFDTIIKALTGPLTAEETAPKDTVPEAAVGRTIEITADSFEGALEGFNRLYHGNGWGDGLPLVPPTEAAVARMLGGTSRLPEEIIGNIPSPDGLSDVGVATVGSIAVNAVMAGARPEFLPTIIAAMECLTDPAFSMSHVMSSEGSFTLIIMVSGPAAGEMGMHAGIGLFGHGWPSNNTIGRAVRLSLLNLGNMRPAEVYDMALIGRPSSHTFFTAAENEELSPWGPYHTGLGFGAEESCVTVSTVGGYDRFGLKLYGGGAVEPWTAESVLGAIVDEVAGERVVFAGYRPGVGNPMAHPRKHVIIVQPELAIRLNRQGFTRKDVQQHIYERTSVPYEELTPDEIRGIRDRMGEKSRVFFGADVIPEDRLHVFEAGLRPGGSVPVLISPEDIHIFVAGGVPGYTFGMTYFRSAHQTRPIRK